MHNYNARKPLCSYFRVLSLYATRPQHFTHLSKSEYSPSSGWIYPARVPAGGRHGVRQSGAAWHLKRLVGPVGLVSTSTSFPAEGWWVAKSTIKGPQSLECIDYMSIQVASPAIPTWCFHSGTNCPPETIAKEKGQEDVCQDPTIFHHHHTEVSREQKYFPLYMKKCKWDCTCTIYRLVHGLEAGTALYAFLFTRDTVCKLWTHVMQD